MLIAYIEEFVRLAKKGIAEMVDGEWRQVEPIEYKTI